MTVILNFEPSDAFVILVLRIRTDIFQWEYFCVAIELKRLNLDLSVFPDYR